MARIRTIKPEFFTSEDIVALTPLARLLFIATWLEADREGRLEWKPNTLKMRYLPADACSIATLCEELVGAGLVVLYGEGLAVIPGFPKHQNINGKESPSRLPAPPDGLVLSRGSRVDNALARDMDALLREKEAGGRVPDAPSLPSPSIPFRSGGGTGGTTPVVRKRNGAAEFEHPRFDVPTWWHLEAVKGLADGERRLMAFYAWLAARVERTNEDTLPRKEWLNRCFAEWLAETTASSSGVPGVAETERRYLRRKAAES